MGKQKRKENEDTWDSSASDGEEQHPIKRQRHHRFKTFSERLDDVRIVNCSIFKNEFELLLVVKCMTFVPCHALGSGPSLGVVM